MDDVPTRSVLPRPNERIALGELLRVSPICVGAVGDAMAISAAFEAGINFFFVSADMHWPLYAETRRGLKDLFATAGRRDCVVIAGVSYVTQPEFCEMPFRELVDEVPGLERLDVLLAGGAYGDEIDRRLAVYGCHRERSHCGARAIGATFHDREACAKQLSDGKVDVAFARYSARHPGARADLFPSLGAARAPLFTFKSTAGWVSPAQANAVALPRDFWLPEITDHYRFALSCEKVSGLLIAVDEPDHIRQLDDALGAGSLDIDEQMHLIYLAELAQGKSSLNLPLK